VAFRPAYRLLAHALSRLALLVHAAKDVVILVLLRRQATLPRAPQRPFGHRDQTDSAVS